MAKLKFEFGTDFQELILKYTVTEKKGYKALELYEDGYFALLHHAVIAFALKKYYKKKKRIPEEPVLRETIRVLYVNSNKEMFSALSPEDHTTIDKTIARLYTGLVSDADTVIEKCIKFARYAKFKDEIEKVDINNFDSYEASANKLKAASNIGSDLEDDYGIMVVGGMKDRAHKRDVDSNIHPTPFWQYNKLLNSGGLTEGSVVLVAAQAKRFKTGFMLNVAKLLIRRNKRKVLYVDFENGEKALTTRTEQSILGIDQQSITSGDNDERLLKIMRKYKRIGGEIVIKRFAAYIHTMSDVQTFIDKCKMNLGLVFTDLVIDYPDLAAAISGKTDEFNRISDTFVDIKNLAAHNKFWSTWVASHVKGEAKKRRETRYTQEDLAKCIDKMRHVEAALGLQESDEEKEAGVMRLEVIDQRNGKPDGAMLFWVDMNKQTMKEFTKIQVKDYWIQMGGEDNKDKKVEKKSDL